VADLEVNGLLKRLGNHLAVDGVTFRIAEGQLLVILGSSGSGKTTVLRMICGLETPDEGTIFVGGHDVTHSPPRERNLGMVFQEYGLYPGMDVYGNIAYGLQARGGLSDQEIDQRVHTAAARLGLSPHLQLPITDLSGGEQQRVALGRAMVKDADAYLFDEPLSNLDPKLRYRMRRDILDLHKSKGKPTLYVTHDQAEAFAMADAVAVMSHGRLQQIGTPDELMDNPANAFVARFVGSPPMNLAPGTVVDAAGVPSVQLGKTVVPLSSRWGPALEAYGKQDVLIGFRPEEMRLGAGHDNGRPDTSALTGSVLNVEPLIGETIVRLRTGDDVQFAAVLRDGDGDHVHEGQQLRLDLDTERIRLFDPETEQALTP
jgi:multiple sugar transport system ATP-binding protein